MKPFCPDVFYDEYQSWNTTNPNLSHCLRDTVLTVVPCSVPWIALMYGLCRWKSDQAFQMPVSTRLAAVKTVLTMAMIASVIGSFLLKVSVVGWNGVYPSEHTHLFAFLATLLLVAMMQWSVAESSALLSFWILLSVCNLPSFKANIEAVILGTPPLKTVILLSFYPLAVIQLVLYAIKGTADKWEVIQSQTEPRRTIFSYLFFTWMTPFIRQAHRHEISHTQLPEIPKDLRAQACDDRFQAIWNRARSSGTKPVSLAMQLARYVGFNMVYIIVTRLIYVGVILLQPRLLERLMKFTQSDEPLWRGFFYIIILSLHSIAVALLYNISYYVLNCVTLKIMSGVTSMIYKKLYLLSNESFQRYTTGEISSLMSADSSNIAKEFPCLASFFYEILTIAGSFYLLSQVMGLAALVMCSGIIIFWPFFVCLIKNLIRQTKNRMQTRDVRIELVREVIEGMRVVKLYGWEEAFSKDIAAVRKKESGHLRSMIIGYGAFMALVFMMPILMTAILFFSYVMIYGMEELTATNIFVSISLIGILNPALGTLPGSLRDLFSFQISLSRIGKFLNAEESEDMGKVIGSKSAWSGGVEKNKAVIQLSNASFSWEKKTQPALKNITLNVPSESLVAIVGDVGSGKTAMLTAMLNGMELTTGSINLTGSVAYCPQRPWILSTTVKDNIVLAKQAVQTHFYEKVLQACALKRDIMLFPGGDRAEIGENGINISGGQKQRMSIARAVMSDSDIYFLDDPLSALDPPLVKHVFENVIDSTTGLLKNKTRILVTNDVSYLDRTDFIVVLNKGSVIEEGSYRNLININGKFASIVREKEKHISDLEEMYLTSSKSSPANTVQDPDESPNVAKVENLIEDEEIYSGYVPFWVYKEYFLSLGPWKTVFSRALGLLSYVSAALCTYCLSMWANYISEQTSEKGKGDKNLDYIWLYVEIGVFAAIFQLLSAYILGHSLAAASNKIHKKLLQSISRSRMDFFETNPLGRILNRFSSDINSLDTGLPKTMISFFGNFSNLIVVVGVSCSAVPIFIPALIPFGFVFWRMRKYFNTTNRQMSSLQKTSLSPLFVTFSESLTGLSSIKAYSLEDKFIFQVLEKIGIRTKCFYYSKCAGLWLAIQIGLVGTFFTSLVSCCVVLFKNQISIGVAGITILYSTNITSVLRSFLSGSLSVESGILCLERILEYCNNPEEGRLVTKADRNIPHQWPRHGNIVFDRLSVSYRKDLDLALANFSLTIKAGEKIGICGRSGAGKSTLLQSLLRLVQPQSGRIMIDGTDIANLGLRKLRSSLTLIPQEPVLFLGTVRSNLDPLTAYSNKELWLALEKVHLKEHIRALDLELNHEVTAKGGNFSGGQKQLLSLARALLRKTKILVLDEATASVDLQTDSIMQSVIRTEFADSTVITVAHRINTIIDSDQIAVIDEGRLKEVGSPEALLADESSIFNSLLRAQSSVIE